MSGREALFGVYAVTLSLWASVLRAAEPAEARAGEYRVRLGDGGVQVFHGERQLSLGSYFTVFKAKYEGSVLDYRRFWAAATVEATDGRLSAEATLPEGRVRYTVSVSEQGVEVELRVVVSESADVGPTEYSVLQMPPALVAGGRVQMLNAAGVVTETVPVPGEPKRGGMGGSGDVLRLVTPESTVEVSSEEGTTLYPFDARVPQYGARQGLWPFSGIPVSRGYETVLLHRLTVRPPAKPREPGTVTFADGTAVARIVVAAGAGPRERLAADELAEYLAAICGCRLPVEEAAAPGNLKGTLWIGSAAVDSGFVAREELEDLKRDGYFVRVGGGRGAVCGWRDLGSIYGGYALLREMGVRFYAPGCEVVPRVSRLVIPDCELRTKPLLEFRKTTQNLKLGHTPTDDLGSPREIGASGSLVHSAAYLLPFDEYGDTHPEYFALQKDGKRLSREEGKRFDVHLCLSNADVRRISAERLLALIEKQPDRTFFGVSQGDGFAWCHCASCEAQDAVPGREMADRLLDYVNHVARRVAETYPDKRILTLAYTRATSPPPLRTRPEPNVMVQFCPYPGRVFCQSHDLTCEKNEGGLADLQGWLRLCPDNMYIFDYPRGYKIWYEPFGSFYAMRRKMDRYLASGIRGIYYCGVPTNFRDLFVYVQSAMHWDKDVDVEGLIDEFMTAYYGAAAPFVRAYFGLLHRETEERQVHQMCEGANPGLMTAELAEKALTLFADAEAAVADDRARLYRVRDEKFCVLFADLNERNPVAGNLAVREEVFAARVAEFMELGRILRRNVVGRREAGIVSDWLYRTCRIRTNTKPWYADPLCRRMRRSPYETLTAERRAFCQEPIEGGLLLELDAFTRCRGPEEYSHLCEARRAVWIYGTNTKTPEMVAELHLDQPLGAMAKLVLTGQDDDKPGSVRIEILLNGHTVFSGANGFREKGWSARELRLDPRWGKVGRNALRIRTLDPSAARDAGWFMLSGCTVRF